MLNLGNLSVNNVDLAMLVAYAVLCLVNKRAYASLILAMMYLLIHASPFRSFHCYMLVAMIYFFSSTLNIKITLEIRQAFICFGVIYLVMALHNFISYHFGYNPHLDIAMKPTLIVVNAYVISHLFGDWRRNNVGGFANYCARCVRRYKIRSLHHCQLPENKT